MNVILAYDVSIRQDEVKDALKQAGFVENWIEHGETKRNYLPNTTLGTRDFTHMAAIIALKKIIELLNTDQTQENTIELLRVFACDIGKYSHEPGKPYEN